ncbi:unnamed protein product [Closterium sp. NIES-65]|nr:unnamed protein product [Closterium sp. NIES-65]
MSITQDLQMLAEGTDGRRHGGELIDAEVSACSQGKQRGEDVEGSGCGGERMWRGGDVDGRDVEGRGCRGEGMWRGGDVEGRGYRGEGLWRGGDVEGRGCGGEGMWRGGDVEEITIAQEAFENSQIAAAVTAETVEQKPHLGGCMQH